MQATNTKTTATNREEDIFVDKFGNINNIKVPSCVAWIKVSCPITAMGICLNYHMSTHTYAHRN